MSNNLAHANLLGDLIKDPETQELLRMTTAAISDAKGLETKIIDVSDIVDHVQYVIVASGTSDRQVQGITNRVVSTLKKDHITPINIDGFETGHWVSIDCGNIMINIFYAPDRARYDLEGLWWQGREIRLI